MTEAGGTRKTPARADVDGNDLVWPCSMCGAPIADRDGYLTVSVKEADERHPAAAAGRADINIVGLTDADGPTRATTLADLLSVPPEVPWWALHDDCGPEPDDLEYWIAIERVRTVLALIKWTAHLYDKRWFADTTWMDILEHVGSYAPHDQG